MDVANRDSAPLRARRAENMTVAHLPGALYPAVTSSGPPHVAAPVRQMRRTGMRPRTLALRTAATAVLLALGHEHLGMESSSFNTHDDAVGRQHSGKAGRQSHLADGRREVPVDRRQLGDVPDAQAGAAPDGAVHRRHRPGDGPQDRGLAGPRRADEPEELALVDDEIHCLDHRWPAVPARHVLEAHQRIRHRRHRTGRCPSLPSGRCGRHSPCSARSP